VVRACHLLITGDRPDLMPGWIIARNSLILVTFLRKLAVTLWKIRKQNSLQCEISGR
jgi:hypothetical protein